MEDDDDDLRENTENGIAVVIKMKDSDHADEGMVVCFLKETCSHFVSYIPTRFKTMVCIKQTLKLLRMC